MNVYFYELTFVLTYSSILRMTEYESSVGSGSILPSSIRIALNSGFASCVSEKINKSMLYSCGH
ncbi:hypothetical protein T4C_10778 [Trichinella pseudospiralis]|uniref:Uncharacterized protein n=1 Tax=Trichinella pseudospiralis TaxID=6337 RepID=A0A0V1K793_TRIPS|nr:hypothetical protein T4C_10778 [Trichinella pseudospiralis]